MNLITSSNIPAMSSVDIAKLTGKDHGDVLKAIRTTLAAANIDAGNFAAIYKDAYDREKPCYYLPKYEMDLVISGYSVPYRAAIIKRWHELEAEKTAPAFTLPASFAEALQLAADQARQLEIANGQIEQDKPKVEFFDVVTASPKVVDMAIAAQTAKLPFGRNILYQKLRELGVLISSGTRHNLPKQRYIEQGLFTVDEFTVKHNSGESELRFTTHVTQKGIAWLIEKFGKEAA